VQRYGTVRFASKANHVPDNDDDISSIKEARVVAFEPGDFNNIIQETISDDIGNYYFKEIESDKVGLYCELKYQDPTEIVECTIRNYYNWDPDAKIKLSEIEQPIVVIFPHPVILQGGLHGGVKSWEYIGEWKSALEPGKLRDCDYTQPTFMTFKVPSHKDAKPGGGAWGPEGYNHNLPFNVKWYDINGIRLRDWITGKIHIELKKHIGEGYELPAMNIICHSMGGIITRGFCAQCKEEWKDIYKVVSLDGVHGGTIWARYWPNSYNGLGDLTALGEIKMNGYYRGDNYEDIGWNKYRKIVGNDNDWLLFSCTQTFFWDDLVDPDSSALGFGRKKKKIPFTPFYTSSGQAPITIVQGKQCTVHNIGHSGIQEDDKKIEQIVEFLTTGIIPQSKERNRLNHNNPTMDYTYYEIEKSCVSGTSTGDDIYVDSNGILDVKLLLTGEGVSFDYTGPSGTLVPPDVVWKQVGEETYLITFTVATPPIAETNLTLIAGPDSDAEMMASIGFPNKRYALIWGDETSYSIGSTVNVHASLYEENGSIIIGSNGIAKAEIRLPDETASMLDMFDDGLHNDGAANDGEYGNEFNNTIMSGRYDLLGYLTTEVDAGEYVERSSGDLFVIDPDGAYLTGTISETAVDEDSNLLFEAVEFSIELDIQQAGTYIVQGELRNQDDELITFLRNQIEATGAGTEDIILKVTASELWRNGEDGPWKLQEVVLSDQVSVLKLNGPLSTYYTTSYQLSDFELPAHPVVDLIAPWFGYADGGNKVFIVGSNLDFANKVLIDGQVTSFQSLGPGSIQVTVPPIINSKSVSNNKGNKINPLPIGEIVVDVQIETPWTNVVVNNGFTYLMMYRSQDK